MIEIGGQVFRLDDPVTWGAAGGAILLLLMLLLLWLALRAARRSARAVEPLAQHMAVLGQNVQQLGMGQEALRGGLQQVSDSQANGQVQVVQVMETRLAAVQQHMNDRLADNAMRSARSLAEMQERMKESLHGSSKQTATSLTALQERLAVIDKAQDNITKLSGDVLSLQDILSNKQRRGMFGEIQLRDIVDKALPPDAFTWQAALSNGKRADCLIHLPNPPGPIVIDAKFPLEDFEALAAAETRDEAERRLKAFGAAVRVHIRAISEKYILDGETADGALMFVPSEAIYAELHARLPQIVREGFDARVWIVSPTTCMATLNTMRAILKDARMREQAGAIRKELSMLHKDVERLGDRVGNLDRHFALAQKDIGEIRISAEKAGNRAQRLDRFDFEDLATEDVAKVVPLAKPEP